MPRETEGEKMLHRGGGEREKAGVKERSEVTLKKFFMASTGYFRLPSNPDGSITIVDGTGKK